MNITDYVRNFGDKTFDVMPFNRVDALVLSQFAYLKLDGFVPGVGTFTDAVPLYRMASSDKTADLFTDERYKKPNSELFDAMVSSERFKNVGFNHFIDLINSRWEMQFSAVTAYLSPNDTHVIFRGTDETLIGWKEDFNMSFIAPIPAQVKAVDYLHYAAERIRGPFSVGGHSKGGNLAVYSSMKCSRYVRDRIKIIYSQDGPGFPRQTLEDSDFDAVSDRIEKFVPHSSIFGMIMQTQEKYRVVEAKSIGILQHDPFNWVIDGDDFVYRDDVAGRYVVSDTSVNEWIERADPDEMKVFFDKVFEVFASAGINDVNDFKGNLSSLLSNAKSVLDGLDDEDKKRIKAVLSVFAESVMEQIKGSLPFNL